MTPSDNPNDIMALLAKMDAGEKKKLDRMLEEHLNRLWHPTPGPQLDAYMSKADVLLYGGAAGGGKTDLIVGLAIQDHMRTLIIRRQLVDLIGLEDRLLGLVGAKGYNSIKHRWTNPNDRENIVELGGLKDPDSERDYQGRPHDLICFDETAQLREHQVQFVMGWLRPMNNSHGAKGRRCRVIMATNPPTGGDGLWLLEWFAPWLDPLFPNPAKPGELRWCIVVKGKTVWKEGPGIYEVEGKKYTALSRSFIPAKLNDNPYLRDTNYRAQIEAMPEPLRTQLLEGTFGLSREDTPKQVVPSSYVQAAVARWRPDGYINTPMTSMALDVAFGGQDTAILSAIHDQWFASLVEKPGVKIEHSSDLSGFVFAHRRGKCPVAVDMGGGYGIGVSEHLIDGGVTVHKFNGSKKVEKRQTQGGLKFGNLRAQVYWEFREDLSPLSDFRIALPPDTRLAAEFAAIEGGPRAGVYYVQSKDEIRSKLGTSTDRADAIVMNWWARKRAWKTIQANKIRGNSGQRDAAPIEDPFSRV